MEMHGSISGAAITRATDAMLRVLGGDSVSLLFSALGMPDDPAAQLGLTDPGVEEVPFAPVVVRTLSTDSNGPRRRLQFLIRVRQWPRRWLIAMWPGRSSCFRARWEFPMTAIFFTL